MTRNIIFLSCPLPPTVMLELFKRSLNTLLLFLLSISCVITAHQKTRTHTHSPSPKSLVSPVDAKAFLRFLALFDFSFYASWLLIFDTVQRRVYQLTETQRATKMKMYPSSVIYPVNVSFLSPVNMSSNAA